MFRTPFGYWLWWTLLAFSCLIAWDASGLDLPVARLFGTSEGFALRDNWLLVKVMHQDAKTFSWILVIVLFVAVAWPASFFRSLERSDRLQLALSIVAAVLAVTLLKQRSHTSCPWDLDAFGGVARYVSHWRWAGRDGGPGHCFPAGHASAGFSFLAGYFVVARRLPRLARWWLFGSLASGLILGLVQQLRGAHYASHTLWTGWVCWVTGLLIDFARTHWRIRAGKPSPGSAAS